MSILAIVGSARGDGHTSDLLDVVLASRIATRFDLCDFEIRPYEYGRALEGDDFARVVDAMASHQIVVFATSKPPKARFCHMSPDHKGSQPRRSRKPAGAPPKRKRAPARHLLEAIPLIKLEAHIGEAQLLYGEAFEATPHEHVRGAITYTYRIGNYHEAVITASRHRVQEVTYWSARANPNRDLVHMARFYSEGIKWTEMTPGYSYRREDDYCWLWCSAMPAIGVGLVAFRDRASKREKKR